MKDRLNIAAFALSMRTGRAPLTFTELVAADAVICALGLMATACELTRSMLRATIIEHANAVMRAAKLKQSQAGASVRP